MFLKLFTRFFGAQLDFRVRLFNVLAVSGAIVSLLMAVSSLAKNQDAVNTSVNFAITVMSFALLIFSQRTGRYQTCYMIAIVGIFILLFPVLFFVSGGYFGGMPAFFVFAVAFTVFMLEGKRAIFFSVIELVIYIAICAAAYVHPEIVYTFSSEEELMTDVVVAFASVCVVLGVCMFLHFRIYNEQQRKLDEQNRILENLNSMKTEFLQDIKHEIRNPLLVISTGTDFVRHNVETGEDEAKAMSALTIIQDEAMRLGRMIDGMVELAIMSGNPINREKTDFAALLQRCAEALKLSAEQKGDTLRMEIPPDLPYVFAEPEQLMRVPVNLFSNAILATEDGEITLEAAADNTYITVTVRDDGSGIDPELLPHVFERGVTGGAGKGYGLSICKTIVEAHGGLLHIESELGRGTAVTFTIPVYGGQSEEAAHE